MLHRRNENAHTKESIFDPIIWGSEFLIVLPSCYWRVDFITAMTAIKHQVNDREIKISCDAAASIHEEGIVILHARKGRLFGSNRAGAYIWRCIEQRLSIEEIAEKISSEYQIARATARQHAARFLTELERHSLIERGAES